MFFVFFPLPQACLPLLLVSVYAAVEPVQDPSTPADTLLLPQVQEVFDVQEVEEFQEVEELQEGQKGVVGTGDQ